MSGFLLKRLRKALGFHVDEDENGVLNPLPVEEGVQGHEAHQNELVFQEPPQVLVQQVDLNENENGNENEIVHEGNLTENNVDDRVHMTVEADILTRRARKRAKMLREITIRQMHLDAKTEAAIINSTEELKTLIESHVNLEKNKHIAKQTVSFLKDFWKMKDKLADDPMIGTEEKGRILYNFARLFVGNIEIYKELYLDNLKDSKRKRSIIAYIDRYERLIEYFDCKDKNMAVDNTIFTELGLDKNESHKKIFGTDDQDNDPAGVSVLKRAQDKVHEINGDSTEEVNKRTQRRNNLKQLDAGLASDLRVGIDRIDALLINYAINDTKRLPFVNKILTLSMRERLYMYYIVETPGRLAHPSQADVVMSQVGYKPNGEALASRLSRTNFRLWEVINPDRMTFIYWEMLETAFQQVQDANISELILAFGNWSTGKVANEGSVEAQQKTEEKDEQKTQEKDEQKTEEKDEQKTEEKDEQKTQEKDEQKTQEKDEQKEVPQITDGEIRQLDEDLSAKEKKRNDALVYTYGCLIRCEEAVRARDEAWVTTRWYRQKAVDKAQNEAENAIERLKLLDEDLTRKAADIVERYSEKLSVKTYEEEDKAIGDLLYGTGQATLLFSKANMVPKLFAENIYKFGKIYGVDAPIEGALTDFSMKGRLTSLNALAGALGTAAGVVSAISAVQGAITAVKAIRSGELGDSDSWLAAAKAVRGMGAAGTMVGTGITNVVFAAPVAGAMLSSTAWEGAIASMKVGMKAAGTVVAGSGMLLDVADYAVQAKHLYHHEKSLEHFADAEDSLSQNENTYVKNMMALDERNKGRQAVATSVSLLSNTMSLGATLTASAGVGLGLALGSVALGIVGKITDYAMKGHSQRVTVEEFLQIDDFSWLFGEQGAEKLKQLTGKEKKEVRKNLLRHMAAELGYTNFRSMYMHIVGKYAAFIYKNLFFDRNGKPYFWNVPEDDLTQGCIQFVKGLGLTVTYPTDASKAEQERHPSARMIAAKLAG